MSLLKLPFTTSGKCISGLMCIVLASTTLMQFSCGGLPSGDPSEFFGLLVNTDLSSDLLGGIRSRDGKSLSLYGTFKSDGSIDELQEIVYQDEQDRVSSLQLSDGKPSLATLHDGSTITITYDRDASNSLRLVGNVDIYVGDEGQELAGQTFSVPFDIDLQATLNDVAQRVSDLTGGAVVIDTGQGEQDAVPDQPNGRSAKDTLVRQEFLGVLLFAAIVAASGFLLVSSMSGMLDAAEQTEEVTPSGPGAIILAIFLPFIVIGELCRLAATSVPLTIEVEITPDYLPDRPSHHH